MARKMRRTKRVAFRRTVHFGPSPQKPHDHIAFTTDLSEEGTHIKTNGVYKPGTRLYLVVENDDRSYEAEGVVVWAKKVTPKLVRNVKNGMGIKFTHVNPELVDLYQEKAQIFNLPGKAYSPGVNA